MRSFLDERMAGRLVERVEVASFSALKTVSPPPGELVNSTVDGVSRQGKLLLFETHGPGEDAEASLVIHFGRAGWLRWKESLPPARARLGRGPLALRLGIEGGAGFEVTEAGTERHLALWIARELSEVGPLRDLGPDPTGKGFSLEDLEAALSGRRGWLKGALTDQRVLAGVGNAYSDEVLHAARLSPFKPVENLSLEEVERLHSSLVGVLGLAIERARGMGPEALKGDKKAAMAVHGRAGEACPVCGDTVREVSFASRSLQYCPTCQTGGKLLADRRLSRLLK